MNHRLLNLLGKYLTSLFFFITFVGIANGQVVTTGTDFWFTMLENFQQSGPIGMRVYISSTVGSTGTVSVPGCFFSQNFNCPPNGVVFVQLPNCAEPNGSGVIQNKAIRVTSVNPVSVYSLNASDFTTDGTMIMPVNTLGYDYYVMAYKNPGINDISESEISFCAVMPNTQIELIPSANTLNGFPAFVPQIITMNPGQMMQVQARGDLTGTRLRVIGNNCLFPIAVFGGNRCSVVGNNCTACDHLYEMVSPISSLGRQYTYVPTFPGQTADMIRILAVQNGTNVTVNGVPQPVLNAGAFTTLDANTINTTSAQISSNNPIAVASLGKGNSCRNPQVGDPMMMMLTPVDVLGVTSVNLATVDISPPNEHYINLVTATPNTGNITITPAPINCEAWNPVPGNPALSTRRCRVNPGNFNVTSSGTGFNIYQYGWGRFDSYGMAGAGLVNQNTIGMSGSIAFRDSICTNTPKSFTAIAQNGNVIQRLTWDWGDNSPIETGPANTHTTRNHTYIGCGTYTIKVEYETNNGRFCAQRIVNVWAKPTATVQPPTNRVCPGATTTFSVRFENTCTGRLPWGNQPGVVPFHAIYQINGVTQPPVVAMGNRTITVTTPRVNSCQTYRFISVSNQYQPWTGTRCEEIMTDSFTVCPTPLQVNVVANPLTVCAGQSSTLTASGAVNYNWNNGQFLGNPFVVTPNVTTTYTVVGTDNNNCTASATVTVTVNPAPEPPSVTPVNPVFCRGQQNACFTATHPSNNVTFHWSNGINGPNNCVPTNVPGNFSIQVQVRLNGCPSTFTTVNYSVQDILPPTPPQPQSVCAGIRAFFAIPNNEIQNGDQFFWRDITKNTLTGPANSYTTPPMIPLIQDPVNGYPSPANFCVYRVRNGCQSECVPFSVNIIVPPAPNGTISPNPICTNQLSELIVNGPNLPGVRFSWYTVANGGAPIFTNLVAGDRRGIGPFVTAGTYSYYLEANLLNCTSGRQLVTLTVQPSSVAGTINANPQTLCSGSNSQLTLSGHQGQILRWESAPTNQFLTVTTINNTTTTLNANNLTQSVCFRAVVQNNNCPPANNNGICIQVDQPPVAGTINPASRTICEGTALGNIVLSGSSGNIIWESSTDCPAFTTFTTINNTTSTLTVGVLTQNTCYRARVSRGVCPAVVSNIFTATIDLPTIAGTIAGTVSTVCSGGSSQLTLSGHRTTILRWESAPTNQFLTITTINNTTTTLNANNLTQSVCYRAVVQNGVCPALNSEPFCIQVDALPVAGTINQGNITVCQGSNVGNIVLTGSSGSIIWESSNDCPAFSTLTTINNTTATLTVGAITQQTCYRARVSNGICPSVVSNVFTASVDLPTLAGTISGTSSLCSGGTSDLTLSGHRGTILRWESAPTNQFLTVSTINNNTTTYNTGNLTQTTCYRAVVQNGVCPSANSPAFCVQVDQPPVVGSINQPNVTLCQGIPVGNIVLSNASGTITWESSTDCPNFSAFTTINNNSLTLSVGVLNATTCYRARVSRGICPSVVSNIFTVTILPTQPGVVQNSQTVCLGTDPNPLTLTNYTGNILRWESSTNGFLTATTINNNTPNYQPTGLTTFTCFRAIVQLNSCTAPSTSACVRVDQPSIAGTLTANRNPVCVGGSVRLTLTGQQGNVLRWEGSQDPTFSTLTTYNQTLTTFDTPQINVVIHFRAVVQNGVCPAVITPIITITTVPNTERGVLTANQTICDNNPNGANTLTLTGLIGSVIRWESSTNNFVTANSIQFQATTLRPFNVTQTTQYRVLVNTPNCGQSYTDPITVTVIPANQGGTVNSNLTVCRNGNNGTLTLTGHAGTILGWERSTNNGLTFTTITPLNVTTSQNFTNLTVNTMYRVKVLGICGTVYSTNATVRVVSNPIGGTVLSNQTVCPGQLGKVLILTAYSGRVTRWESSTDNGVTWTTINSTSPVINPGIINQTTLFRAYVESDCAGMYSNTVTLFVPQGSAGTLSQDMTICGTPTNGTLTLTGYTGSVAAWEGSTDNFITVQPYGNQTPTFSFENLTTTTKYRAKVNIGGCYLYSNAVQITVYQNLSAGFAGPDQTICDGSVPQQFVLEGYSGAITRWESSTDCFASQQITVIPNTEPFYRSSGLSQTTCFRAVITYPECGELASLPAKVTVLPIAAGGTITADQSICGTNPVNTLTLSGYSGTIVRWESSTDNFASFANISNTSDTYTPATPTVTTKYRAVISSKGCGEVYSTSATITVIGSPIGGTLSASQTICANTTPESFTLTGYNGDILNWEYSTDNFASITTININTPTLTLGNQTQSRCYRAKVGVTGCGTAYSNSVCISVVSNAVGGTLFFNQTVCMGNNPSSLVLSGYSGRIIRWERSTDNFVTNTPISNTLSSYNSGLLTQTTQYRVVLQNAPCAEVYSSIATITIISNSTNAGTLSANQTYCESNPTPITLNLTGYTGSIIRWESSDNNFQSSVTIGNTNSSYTIPNLTRTTQFRVMVQGAGCTPAYSNIITVTYLSNGQAGILARVGTSLPNCGSNTGSVQLNNYIGTIVDWEQSTDGGTTWTSIGWDLARYDYTIATTTVFRVKVNNPSCGTIYSPTITVAPSLTLTATPYRECGNTGKIVAVANGGTPNYTYTLTPNVGIQTQLGVFTGFPAGTYTVTVKDQFNCTASATVVIPNTVSAPRIYQTVFEGNNSARVYWEAVSGNAEYEIQYSVAGMNQWVSQYVGTSTNYLIPDLDANTLYEVQVRVRCNPSIIWSDWSPSTYFGTETREATSSIKLKGIEVYPNPTNGQFIIQYDYTDTGSFEINDLAGKVIHSGKLAPGNNEILLPNATSGVYSLIIQSGTGRKVMKIVVQR